MVLAGLIRQTRSDEMAKHLAHSLELFATHRTVEQWTDFIIACLALMRSLPRNAFD
jgi:hypothetical protein